MKSKYKEGVPRNETVRVSHDAPELTQNVTAERRTVSKEVTFQFEECHAVARTRKYILTLAEKR